MFGIDNKEIKYFSRTLTEFKDFSRQLPQSKTFSRLYEPWIKKWPPVVIIVWEKEKSLKTLLEAWTIFALPISFSVVENFFQAYIVYIEGRIIS